MPESFKTSFIPKAEAPAAAKRRRSSIGLLSAIATVVFVIALVLAGGAFLYEQLLGKSLVAKEEALERARAAFEPELIRELSRVDKKIKSSEVLLRRHVVLTPLFTVLEDFTLQSVRFTSFSVQGGADGITLSMGGQADGFAAIALQSDAFGKNRYLRNVLFSGLTLDQEGRVAFSLSASVDSSLVSFENALDRSGGVSATEDIETTPIQ